MTDQQLEQARKLGASAGARTRATGIPTRNPFRDLDDDRRPLRDAWAVAYVDAAYKRQQ